MLIRIKSWIHVYFLYGGHALKIQSINIQCRRQSEYYFKNDVRNPVHIVRAGDGRRGILFNCKNWYNIRFCPILYEKNFLGKQKITYIWVDTQRAQ